MQAGYVFAKWPVERPAVSEENFALRMREARRARGLSQAVVADKVGVSKAALLHMENHTRHIRLGEALLIADALDVPLPRMLSAAPINTEVTLR